MSTFYRPPNQGTFTETITKHFSKIKTKNAGIILGEFKFNPFPKQKIIFHQTNT